jgi:hypothetical protein
LQVTTQLRVDAADLLPFNPHLQTLDYAARRSFCSTVIQITHLRLGEDLAERAALER